MKHVHLIGTLALAALTGCITPEGYDRPDGGVVVTGATGGVTGAAGATVAGTGGAATGGSSGTGGAVSIGTGGRGSGGATGTGGATLPGTGGAVVAGTGGAQAPPGTVLYQDDFESDAAGGNAKNWIVDTIDASASDGTWSVVSAGGNQVLQGVAAGSSFTMDIGGDVSWTNYTLQVDIEMTAGSSFEFGVFGRFAPGTSKDSYYEAYMDDSGAVQLRVRQNGSTTTLGSKSKSTTGNAQLDTVYTFVLDMHGSTISVSVNGTPRVSMVTDSTLTAGGIGLIVSGGTAQFDNVIVTQ